MPGLFIYNHGRTFILVSIFACLCQTYFHFHVYLYLHSKKAPKYISAAKDFALPRDWAEGEPQVQWALAAADGRVQQDPHVQDPGDHLQGNADTAARPAASAARALHEAIHQAQGRLSHRPHTDPFRDRQVRTHGPQVPALVSAAAAGRLLATAHNHAQIAAGAAAGAASSAACDCDRSDPVGGFHYLQLWCAEKGTPITNVSWFN